MQYIISALQAYFIPFAAMLSANTKLNPSLGKEKQTLNFVVFKLEAPEREGSIFTYLRISICLYIKASVKNILVCYFSHRKCLLQRNRVCKCLPENPNCWMFTAKIHYKACMTVQFSPVHLICMANLNMGSTQILWLNLVERYIFKSLEKKKCIFWWKIGCL